MVILTRIAFPGNEAMLHTDVVEDGLWGFCSAPAPFPPPSPEMLAIIGKEICSFPYYFQPESYRSMSCHPSGGKFRLCTRSVMYVGGATDAALPNMCLQEWSMTTPRSVIVWDPRLSSLICTLFQTTFPFSTACYCSSLHNER